MFPLRLFLAAGWTRAAVEKFISPDWWTGAELNAFLAEHDGLMLDTARPFVEVVVGPLALLVASAVLVAQIAIAISLTTGRRLRLGLLVATGLNVSFVFVGAVTPSAFYLMMQLALLLACGPSERSLGSIGLELVDRLRRRIRQGWSGLAGRLSPALVTAPLLVEVETLAPADVIHDPALMLVTAGAITSLALLWRDA